MGQQHNLRSADWALIDPAAPRYAKKETPQMKTRGRAAYRKKLYRVFDSQQKGQGGNLRGGGMCLRVRVGQLSFLAIECEVQKRNRMYYRIGCFYGVHIIVLIADSNCARIDEWVEFYEAAEITHRYRTTAST